MPEATTTAKEKYSYGTGRRKSAIARVRLYPGDGSITVNDKPAAEYFSTSLLGGLMPVLTSVGKEKAFRISAKVVGGGKAGQADAVRHGIARALVELDPELRTTLKKVGYLSRDPREKERKKYGLKRARKAPQFSKR
jgi:small subunit ribosomal protein S9